MLSSQKIKKIRERYNRLYKEDIRMGNICICSEDIPTEDEFVDDFYDEAEYMEEYYDRKYGE